MKLVFDSIQNQILHLRIVVDDNNGRVFIAGQQYKKKYRNDRIHIFFLHKMAQLWHSLSSKIAIELTGNATVSTVINLELTAI